MAVCDAHHRRTDESAELPAWFDEFRRLVAEAEERFTAGEYRPALASLAAIPPVHHLLVDKCGERLDGGEETEVADEDGHLGLYL